MAHGDTKLYRGSRITGFVRRRGKLLSFFGALIVFSTFVVKEGMREYLKNVIDSLDLAQGIFAVRKDNSVTHSQLVLLAGNMTEIEGLLKHVNGNRSRNLLNVAMWEEQVVTPRIASIDSSLRGIEQFIQTLPHNKDLAARLLSAQKRLAKDTSLNRDNVGKTRKWLDVGTNRDDPMELLITKLTVDTLEIESSALNDFTTSISEDAQKAAESYRASVELRYERYSRLSYFLYTLGWTLGLAGRLYGAEGVALEG